jgi:mannosyltransferase
MPADQLGSVLRWDRNMLLYYLLLRGWIFLGESEWMLRSLSTLFGVATIVGVYLLGRFLFSRGAGLLAAGLLTVHATHVRWSQEARSYALLALLLVLSCGLFVRAVVAGRDPKRWIAYAIVSILAVYSHAFALLVLLAQWLSLGVSGLRRLDPRVGIRLVIWPGLAVAPILSFLSLENVGQLDWVPPFTLDAALVALRQLSGDGGNLLLLLYLLGAAGAFVIVPRSGPGPEPALGPRWIPRLLGLWWLLPLAVLGGASVLFRPVFVDRYVFMSVPAVTLLAGEGLLRWARVAGRRGPLLAAAAALGVLALSVRGLIQYYDLRRADRNEWWPAAEYVLTHRAAGDEAFVYPYSAPFRYHLRRAVLTRGKDAGGTVPVRSFFQPSRAVVTEAAAGLERVWLIAPPDILPRTGHHERLRRHLSTVRAALQERFRLVEERQFPGQSATTAVQLYVRNPTGPGPGGAP